MELQTQNYYLIKNKETARINKINVVEKSQSAYLFDFIFSDGEVMPHISSTPGYGRWITEEDFNTTYEVIEHIQTQIFAQ